MERKKYKLLFKQPEYATYQKGEWPIISLHHHVHQVFDARQIVHKLGIVNRYFTGFST